MSGNFHGLSPAKIMKINPLAMPATTTDSGAHFITYSQDFHAVLGSDPRFYTVAETNAHEGPVYVDAEAALYFTTQFRASSPCEGEPKTLDIEIKRIDLRGTSYPLPNSQVKTVRAHSNMANGMTLDRDGSLLVCEQGTGATPARISRMNLQGDSLGTVVEGWRNLPFNSPNDVVVKRDGSIWFTDPDYGFMQGFKTKPQLGNFVYRHDPGQGVTTVVADSFCKPNGLAFSPDEGILYVNDSGAIQTPQSYHVDLPHHIRAFDVIGSRHLANDRLFAVISPGIPDGLKLDEAGNVYSSYASGVQVYSPAGDLIGEIIAPGAANFVFGGPRRNVLYILADTVIYAAELQAVGVRTH